MCTSWPRCRRRWCSGCSFWVQCCASASPGFFTRSTAILRKSLALSPSKCIVLLLTVLFQVILSDFNLSVSHVLSLFQTRLLWHCFANHGLFCTLALLLLLLLSSAASHLPHNRLCVGHCSYYRFPVGPFLHSPPQTHQSRWAVTY